MVEKVAKPLIAFLVRYLLILWVCISTLFLASAWVGDNPVSIYLNPRLAPEVREQLKHAYGYDKPLFEQYILYVTNMVRGEFGVSFIYKRQVVDLLREKIPKSIGLGLLAYVLAALISLLILRFLQMRDRPRLRTAVLFIHRLNLVTPAFVFALLFLHVFGLSLGWFPVFGSGNLLSRGRTGFFETLYYAVLPAMSLALPLAGRVTAYLDAGMEDLEEESFILAARGRGIGESRLFWNHKLRSIWPTALHLSGLYLPYLVSGVLIVETIFGWSGMGVLMYDAATGRDYPLLLGACIWTTFMVVLAYQAADALRRHRLEKVGR